MDDGLPASGSVRLLPGGAANGVAINQTDLVDSGIYTVCAAF